MNLSWTLVGQGRHTFLDGSYYEGQWAAGERVKGMWVSGNNSSEYSGQWRGDLRHGHGVLFTKGLLKYTGATQCISNANLNTRPVQLCAALYAPCMVIEQQFAVLLSMHAASLWAGDCISANSIQDHRVYE